MSAHFPSVTEHDLPPVGREREQAVLRAALATAVSGRGAVVLIGGEAGIGKTALAEWALAEATAQGALVLVGRCYDLAETPPYGPWLELAWQYPAAAGLPPRPALVTDPTALAALPSQATLFVQVTTWLAAVAAARPLVLLLDDLHWADPASLDLLRVVARRAPALRLLVLVTYRSDELTRRHPLYTLLPALDREARAARLELRPLDAESLRALAAARYALPAGDAARLGAWLAKRAEGNAFFTVQLLRALEEVGGLRRAHGGWALDDLASVDPPAALRQVLDARLARLGEVAQRLLILAAVIGQGVPLALWAAVAGADEDELLDTIEAGVAAHLLVEVANGTAIRFAHALVREALYAGVSPARRRRWHQRAGEWLATQSQPDPDAIAHHFRQAGDPRACGWLVRAGERAERAHAGLSAAARFAAAQEMLDGDEARAGERAWLLYRLAWLRRFIDPAGGIATLDEAVRLAAATGEETLAHCALFERGRLRCLTGDFRRGLAEMAAAVDVLTAPDAPRPDGGRLNAAMAQELAHGREILARWYAQAGRFAEAGALVASLPHDAPALYRGYQASAMVAAALGRPEEARRAFARLRTAFLTAGEPFLAAVAARFELAWVLLPYGADDLAARHALTVEAEEAQIRASGEERRFADRVSPPGPEPLATAPDTGTVSRHAALHLLVLEGHWSEAREVGQAVPTTPFTQMVLAPVAHAQGDREQAWAMVRAALPVGPATAPGEAWFIESLALQRVGALLALDEDDPGQARSWLAAHDRWLAASGSVLGRAEGQLVWTAYHRATGDVALAREHAWRALTLAGEPRQPLALLATHRTLGELDTATCRHGAAREHLAQALALADTCAAPYERALTILALAELCVATGDRPGAATALGQARGILASLLARPALARAAALAAVLVESPTGGTTAGLTAREVEVLRLVAAGRSNRAIAANLSLSVRTVERHLENLYRKIDVRTKAEATAYGFRHGII